MWIGNAARSFDLLQSPSFWAEDGTIFFKDSLEYGVYSLFRPVEGHLNTLPRILAWLISYVPIENAPLSYILVSGVVSAFCLSLVYLPGLRWILPSDTARWALGFLCAFIPGTKDCFFNFATETYIIYCAVLCLILCGDEQGNMKMSGRRGLTLSFLWFSAAQSIIALPLLLTGLIFLRDRKMILPIVTQTIASLLNIVATHGDTKHPVDLSWNHLKDSAVSFLNNSMGHGFLIPMLGVDIAEKVLTHIGIVSLGFGFMVLGIGMLFRHQPPKFLIFLNLFLQAGFLGALVELVRFHNSLLLHGRHVLIPSFLTIFMLTGIYTSWSWIHRQNRILRSFLAVFLFSNLFYEGLIHSEARAARFEDLWPEKSIQLQAFLDQKRRGLLTKNQVVEDIPCRPEGWKILRIEFKP